MNLREQAAMEPISTLREVDMNLCEQAAFATVPTLDDDDDGEGDAS